MVNVYIVNIVKGCAKVKVKVRRVHFGHCCDLHCLRKVSKHTINASRPRLGPELWQLISKYQQKDHKIDQGHWATTISCHDQNQNIAKTQAKQNMVVLSVRWVRPNGKKGCTLYPSN